MTFSRNPDLQRLLAGLQDGTYGLNSSAGHSTPPTQTHIAGTEPIPQASLTPSAHTRGLTHSQNAFTTTTADSRHPLFSGTTQAKPYIPDASSITTWPAALKFVTKHIASNEQICNRIRNLILEQHKHEKQWWMQREALIAQQHSRDGSQARAAELLKALGGLSVAVKSASSEENEVELKTFELKVYKSLTQMASHFGVQLRELSVPFFVVKSELIVADEHIQSNQRAKAGQLSVTALRDLQRRMLQVLEDLLVGD